MKIIKLSVRTVILTLLITFFTGSIPCFAAQGEARDDDTPVDIVLLLDSSGTMGDNDPERWTASATKNFVDTLGTENTRLSIISFGAAYGNDAYPVGQQDRNSAGRVKVAYPLTALSDDSMRVQAKEVIDAETSNNGEYTPLGYALEAAVDILEEGGSADGYAAIVLMSDGIVDGQTDYVNPKSPLDYKSVDSSCDRAASHSWPVYCLELNYAGKNVKSDSADGIGYHQMRENIPSRTGTKPFEVKSAEEAKKKLNDIFADFFNAEIEDGTIVVDGTASVKFSVGEMTAEETLTVSGEIDKIDSISLEGPDGTTETYEKGDGNKSSDDRMAVFEEHSALIKLILPAEGTWKLTLRGNGKASVDWSAISLKEMNLDLSASEDGDDKTVEKGTKVQFTANFSYKHKQYKSKSFYGKNEARLYVTGQSPITMKAGDNGYSAEVTFAKEGSYDVYAQVDSDYFREGNKKSGVFTYHVERPPVRAKGEMPELSAGIKKQSDPVRLDDYFEGEDLRYSLEKNKLDDFEYSITPDGVLTLTAGSTSKTYMCTVTADDGSGAGGATQKIAFSVKNRPVELVKSDHEDISLVTEPEEAPGWAALLGGIKKDSDTFTLKSSDYFYDPDGTAPDIRIIPPDEGDEVVSVDQDADSVTLKAEKEGRETLLIVAIDGNSENTAQVMTLSVEADSPVKAAIGKRLGIIIPVVIAIAAAVILLIISFTGRKIYGVWDVTVNGRTQEDVALSKLRSGRRAAVSVSRIIEELGFDEDFPGAEIRAGNPFSRKVYFDKIKGLDNVYLDDGEISPERMEKPVEIGANHYIELNNGGSRAVFERRK